MPERTDRLGQRYGDYWLRHQLGNGGFGDVYLGEHVHDQTLAAVKVLNIRLTHAEELRTFINEVRIFRLQHPHIVRLLDVGVAPDEAPFLVMEYAPGGTLLDRHPKGTRLSLQTVLSYITPMASALQYAHDLHLIHRDVKPENMLLGTDDVLWLSDFGIATVVHNSHSFINESLGGTVLYIAPEQLQGKPRPQSDQYALAIVVYLWLTGTYPFNGTSIEIAMQHQVMPPPSLRSYVPTLPIEVEQIIFTALAKDPRRRFSRIEAFASALEQAAIHTGLKQNYHLDTRQPRTTRPVQSVAVKKDQPSPRAPLVRPPITGPLPERSPVSEDIPASPPISLPTLALSRRQLLCGISALLVVAGGGVFFWRVSENPPIQHVSEGILLYIYKGHTNAVRTVAWSPDDTRLASGSNDTTVQVWNANNGGKVFTYQRHSDTVYAVAWSPDGTRLASGSSDNTVQVWDATNGNNVFTYKGHLASVNAVAWSPDGRRIASGSYDSTVQVWDATDGGNAFIYKGHADTVYTVAWSPDGRRIASGSNDTTVQVWDASNGGNSFIYKRHADTVNSVTWSPASSRLASGSSDNTVQVWDAADGGNVFTYKGHTFAVNTVGWSADSAYIASGSNDASVRVWNATNGSNVFTYKGHAAPINSIVWSPDSKRIASGSNDNTVRVWQAISS